MCLDFRGSIGKPGAYTGERDSGVYNFRVMPSSGVWMAKVNRR